MKLPRFLANSYLSGEDEYRFKFDPSDFYRTKYDPDPQIDDITISFKCREWHNVEIRDTATNKTYKFVNDICGIYDDVEEDVIEYTFGGYQEGKYFEFDEDEREYTEIEPFKYFNEFAEKCIEAGKHDYLYLTDGFEDLNLLIPDCVEDRVTNLETIEDVTEFMRSLGYERLGA